MDLRASTPAVNGLVVRFFDSFDAVFRRRRAA
jgi:hypothetical protein